MAQRKTSIFKRGNRWGFMVRIDNKIKGSGVADTKAEAQKKADQVKGGGGSGRKKATRSTPRRTAKKKTPTKKKSKSRSKISRAGCVVSHARDHGPKTYDELCGPGSPDTASQAAEVLSHGETKARKKGKKNPPRKASQAKRRGPKCPAPGGQKALQAALRRDR